MNQGYVMNRAHQAYTSNAVNTKTQGQLVIMLYDGAIGFIEKAEKAIEGRKIEDAHKNIVKVQKIVNELLITLKTDVGDVATQLSSLYNYMNEQLIQANLKKDVTLLGEVRNMLAELRNTWKEIV